MELGAEQLAHVNKPVNKRGYSPLVYMVGLYMRA